MPLPITFGAASARGFGLFAPTTAGAVDAYFPYVSLLLPGNGTNGAQNNTFFDSSANNFTITRNGNTTQGTFTPYGSNWSNYFSGGASLSIAYNTAWDFGSGNFTIECWVNTGVNTQQYTSLLSADASPSSNGWSLLINASTASDGKILFFENNLGTYITTTGGYNDNKWHHIAVVRNGSTLNIYVDGVSALSGAATGSASTPGSLYIGNSTIANRAMVGYLSNVRIVKGTAVYTSNFTPSTTPLTAISGTSLLTCQSNRFIDNSGNAFAITVTGSPSVQRFSPFNPSASYGSSVIGGSGYFGGSGDSLYNTTTTLLPSTSTTTFTIEGWVYPTSFASLNYIIGEMQTNTGTSNAISVRLETSGAVTLYWFDGAIKTCTGNSTMRLNSWNYFAVVVNANVISIYVNKTTPDSLTGTTTLTNRTVGVGMGVASYYNNNTPAYYFNGYLSDLRVSTVARTISAVPVAPLTSDANVRWLLNFTNAGVIDNAEINDLQTVGNAQITTAQSKFGGGSMYFASATDWLTMPYSVTEEPGSGNLTWEMWINTTNSTQYATLYCRTPASFATGMWSLMMNLASSTAGDVGLYVADYNPSAPLLQTTGVNVRDGAWHHIAVVRNGSSWAIYVDGTSRATATWAGSIVAIAYGPHIAHDQFYGRTYVGYIDDLRITKGYARYTTNFTPPTQTFPTR